MEEEEILKRINSYNRVYIDNSNILVKEVSSDDEPEEVIINQIDVKNILCKLVDIITNDTKDFCVSYNNGDDFYMIRSVSSLFCSNCTFQLSMYVKFPILKKKGFLNFFILDKKSDEEVGLFDIAQKKKIMNIKYPEKLRYVMTDYKLKNGEISCAFNYMFYE